MELAIVIYLIGFFPKLAAFFSAIAFLGIFLVILTSFFFLTTADEEEIWGKEPTKKFWKYANFFVGVSVTSFFLNTFLPEERTMYVMLGAYGAQTVVESEAVGRIAPKSLEIIEMHIDKYMRELEEELSEDVEEVKEVVKEITEGEK